MFRIVAALLVSMVMAIPATAAAQDCIDYSNYIHGVGGVDTPGSAFGVEVVGTFALVADAASGLQVIDISDPRSPEIVRTVDTPGTATGLTVSGNYAYVGEQSGGLLVFDVTDPANAFIVGSVDTPGQARGIAVSGNYAYVADYSSLQVIDISNPAAPFIAAAAPSGGGAVDVAVGGNYAYVCGFDFEVVDITNPTSPFRVGLVDTPSNTSSVSLDGNHAYVADLLSGLQVIDISNPAQPVIVGAFATFDNAYDVVVESGYAYVTAMNWLQVVNVSTPESPTLVVNTATQANTRGLTLSGTHVYLACWFSGLVVVDIANLTAPDIVGQLNIHPPGSGGGLGVAVAGTFAYVADGSFGLQVVDIGVPGAPVVAGTRNTPGEGLGVAVAGRYAYVADGTAGLQVIDVLNPANPVIRGSYNTPGQARRVAVAGNYAYVADGTSGLRVIRVSQPTNPVSVGAIDTPGDAIGVALGGDYAYVADRSGGLQVIRITDPVHPVIVGSLSTPHQALSVAVAGDYAYVLDVDNPSINSYGPTWLLVVDITNPAAPAISRSGCSMPGNHGGSMDIALSGNFAYLPVGFGMWILDLSMPTLPIVGSVALPSFAKSFALAGDNIVGVGEWLAILPTQCAIPCDVAAAFSGAPTAGCTPQTVDFTDQSTGPVTSWSWTFGDGGTSIAQNPSHVYAAAGTYTVGLTVTSATCAAAETKTNYITVGTTPVAAFVGAPTSGQTPLAVTFTDQTTLGPTSWAWSFGDGATSTAQSPSHTYTTAGTFTVMLTATNSCGSDDETKVGYVTVTTPPPQQCDDFTDGNIADWGNKRGTWTATGGYMRGSSSTTDSRTTAPFGSFTATGIDCDVRMNSGQSSRNARIVFAYVDGSNYRFVEGDDSNNRWRIYERVNGSNTVRLTVNRTISTGQWYQVHIDAAANGNVSFAVDGVPIGSYQFAAAVSGLVGVGYNGASSDFDDFCAGSGGARPGEPTVPLASGSLGAPVPAAYALGQNHPNPFNPSTTIPFDVPAAGSITLRVYDLNGRLVRTLVEGEVSAGRHSALWDGKDAGGRALGSGVYLYELRAPGQVLTGRMLLIK